MILTLQLIERSITINPDRDAQKFLNLAEMLTAHEAVNMYKRGIEVLRSDQERYNLQLNKVQVALTIRQQASAFASIAELYMTEPLCDETDAETICEQSLQQALQIDHQNIDALQALANLRMLRGKDKEASTLLLQVVKKIQDIQNRIEESTQIQNMDKLVVEEHLPVLDFRMQTCRLLVELKKFKPAVLLLENIVQEDDEIIEAWYLLAFSFFNRKKWSNAEQCCLNVKSLAEKKKIIDPDLEAGTREIWEVVRKELDTDAAMGGEDDGDSGFETVSEDEDLSSDEEMVE